MVLGAPVKSPSTTSKLRIGLEKSPPPLRMYPLGSSHIGSDQEEGNEEDKPNLTSNNVEVAPVCSIKNSTLEV